MAASRPLVNGTQSQVYDPKRSLNVAQVKRGWLSAIKEYDYWVPRADIEGTLPHDLTGTLMRNGPGLSEVYGKHLIHRKYSTCLHNLKYRCII